VAFHDGQLKEEVMFVIGIDPHKRSHTAAVLDDTEELVGQVRVNADRWQRDRLLRFAAPFEPLTWAVERGFARAQLREVSKDQHGRSRRASRRSRPPPGPRRRAAPHRTAPHVEHLVRAHARRARGFRWPVLTVGDAERRLLRHGCRCGLVPGPCAQVGVAMVGRQFVVEPH
jgi:hypothetical protein